MKPSHFQAPRQLDDAVFYSAQTSGPVGVSPDSYSGDAWITIAGVVVIIGVFAAIIAGWI